MQTNTSLEAFSYFERPTDGCCLAHEGNVLIMGEQFVITTFLTMMLKRFGIKAITTDDTSAAMQILHASPGCFEVVIAEQNRKDVLLSPSMREIIGIRPDIPVLLATGDHDAIFCHQIKTLEGLGLLRRPADFAELFENLGSLHDSDGAPHDHVLVLDNEFPVTRTVTNVLKYLGLRTTVIGDGLESVKSCSLMADRLGLVVSDQTMMAWSRSPLIRGIIDISPDTPILLGTRDHKVVLCRQIRVIENFELICGPADYHDLVRKIRNLISLVN